MACSSFSNSPEDSIGNVIALKELSCYIFISGSNYALVSMSHPFANGMSEKMHMPRMCDINDKSHLTNHPLAVAPHLVCRFICVPVAVAGRTILLFSHFENDFFKQFAV